MQNQHQPASQLESAIAGFAKALAAVAAFFILPYVARNYRGDMYYYMATGIDAYWAHWASWAFVIVVAICCFFGVSALFQLLVQLIFRRSARRSGI